MTLVDSHAHLDYLAREGTDLEGVMQRAQAEGVAWILNPSVKPSQFDDVLRVIERFQNVFAGVAVHPTDVQDMSDTNWQRDIERMLEHPKVIAIGETGLDYYWDKTHIDTQQTFFRHFLSLAQAHGKPIIVHDRDAHEDIHRIIREYPGVRGVMHCFSGDADFARAMMDRGFYISFAGNVTFKNAKVLQEAVQAVPLGRLLVETDSPFLSPMPFRGKPNEPARVRLVAEKIAELKGISVEAVEEATTENAMRVFQPCLS